jgi:hypothetical protein
MTTRRIHLKQGVYYTNDICTINERTSILPKANGGDRTPDQHRVSSLKTDQERVVYILEDSVFILVRRVVSSLDFLLPS